MGKPNKYRSGKAAPGRTTSAKQESPAEKRQRLFAFSCAGMLMYTMPGLACAFMGSILGASTVWMIVGGVLTVLSAGLGFLGLTLMRNWHGKKLMTVLCILMALLTAVPMPFLGSWYLVFLPIFALQVLCIANVSALDKV